MDEFLQAVQADARDSYRRSSSRAITLAVVVVLFYVTFVREYGSMSSSLAETGPLRDSCTDALLRITQAEKALTEFQQNVSRAARDLPADTFDEVRKDFVALDESMKKGLKSPPGLSTKPHPVPPGGGMRTAQMDMSGLMPQAVGERVPIDRVTLEAIRQVRSQGDFLALIEPLVESHIIGRRFADLNTRWKAHLDRAVKKLDEALAAAAWKRESYEIEGADVWTAVTERRAHIKQNILAFEFKRPGVERWWRTVGGKGAQFSLMSHSLSKNVHDTVQIEGLNELLAQLRSDEGELVGRVATLEDRVAELDAQFAEQQQQFSALGVDLRRFGVHLEDVVIWFPVIAALAFAAAIILPSVARLRVARLDVAVAGSNIDRPYSAELFPGVAVRNEVWPLRAMGWVICAVALVVVSAYQLAGWELLEDSAATIQVVVGVVVLGVALGVRVWSVMNIVKLIKPAEQTNDMDLFAGAPK